MWRHLPLQIVGLEPHPHPCSHAQKMPGRVSRCDCSDFHIESLRDVRNSLSLSLSEAFRLRSEERNPQLWQFQGEDPEETEMAHGRKWGPRSALPVPSVLERPKHRWLRVVFCAFHFGSLSDVRLHLRAPARVSAGRTPRCCPA